MRIIAAFLLATSLLAQGPGGMAGAAAPGGSSGGPGSVTSVSCVTANGVSCSVATATTTPALTFTLGAITPSSVTATGSIQSGVGSGEAGADFLLQGTIPAIIPTNSFGFYAPTSIPTAYQWRVPTADAAGAIVSDGAGTPGVLSIVGFSGTGNIARVTSPTFITPVLGAATATSVSAATLTASANLYATLAAQLSYITGSTQCLHVDTSGNVSGTGSDCGTGGGGGATTQLDNLSAVSINSALLAQTGIDLGSTTKPFRNLFISGAGTYGTNYLKFAGTPTSTRTVTFPDATDTVAELGQANSFGVAQSITTNAVTSTQTPGLTIINSTAATNVQRQDSPCLQLTGQYWSGSVSQTADSCIRLDVFNSISYLEFYGRQNGGPWNARSLAIGSDGTLTTGSTLTVGGNLLMAVGKAIDSEQFQDRAATKGYLDTTVSGFNFVNENRTTGNVNEAIRAKASQTADLLQFLSAGGTTVLTKVDVSGNVTIVPQKSTTGSRYVCIDTTGQLVSSAAACVGT